MMSKKDAILASIFPRFWWILVDFGSQVGTENLAKWGLVRSGQVRSDLGDQIKSDQARHFKPDLVRLRRAALSQHGRGRGCPA